MIAIDLGSNTIRFIEYDCKEKEFGKEFEKIVRTAEALHSKGVVSKAAQERIIGAIEEAKKQLNFHTDIKAYATEALRRAKNQKEVIATIKQQTAVSFEIIDGAKEAKLTALAVEARLESLGMQADEFLLVDIGGGSTEIIFFHKKEIVSKSFPLGIVTLTEAAKQRDFHTLLEEQLFEIKAFVKEYKIPKTFVQTAGTPTTIAAFLQGMNYQNYDKSKINGYILKKEDILKAFKELLALDEKQRSFYVGVGREDLIISGIKILLKLYDMLNYQSSVVIDDGLREGIAIEYCQKNLDGSSSK